MESEAAGAAAWTLKEQITRVARVLRQTLQRAAPTDTERLRVRRCLKLLYDRYFFSPDDEEKEALLADGDLLRSVAELLPRVVAARGAPTDETAATAADFAEALLSWLLLRPAIALAQRVELTLLLGPHFEAIVCAALRCDDADRRQPLLEIVSNQLRLEAYEPEALLARSALLSAAQEHTTRRPSDVFGRRVAALAALLPLDAARDELRATIGDPQRSVRPSAAAFGAAVEHSDAMRRRVAGLLGALDGVVAGPAEPALLLEAVRLCPAQTEPAAAALLTALGAPRVVVVPTAALDAQSKRVSVLRQLIGACDAAATRRLKRDGAALYTLLDVAIAEPLARTHVFDLLQRLYAPAEAAGYLDAGGRATLRAALATDPRATGYGDWPRQLLRGECLGPAATASG
eukprot:gene8243-5942_t